MSFIQNMMEKQNSVFILIKKNIDPEFSKEILGVYASHEIALTEKQKHSIINTMVQLNIEGPFIINKNVLSPPGPPPLPISTPNFKNLESLPRFNPIYPNITQMLMNYNSIY